MLGARGAAGCRARGARSAGPWAHPARQGRSPRRLCPLASRLPSGSRGSPQPSKSSSSVSSRLQLASSRLWSSAASIAPRSRAPRGSVSARPAWLPGAGFETERPRERRVLALLAQPDLPDSLRTLRRIARSCQVGTLAERSCKAHGAAGPPARSRPMAAPGGGASRLLSPRPRLPPPAHQPCPGSAFSGPGKVRGRVAGTESVGLVSGMTRPRIEAQGLHGAAKRARPPARGARIGWLAAFLLLERGHWRGRQGEWRVHVQMCALEKSP